MSIKEQYILKEKRIINTNLSEKRNVFRKENMKNDSNKKIYHSNQMSSISKYIKIV